MMQRSTVRLEKMDCSAEEQMVRMALDGLPSVRSLTFDLPQRTVIVHHDGNTSEIRTRLEGLNFGLTRFDTAASEEAEPHEQHATERRLLWAVLGINASLFVIELVAGWLAGSMGLMADSLDMLADSIVYGLSLYAVGSHAAHKKRIAGISGYFQLSLALLGLAEVIRRVTGAETYPSFEAMIGISLLALAGNAACLFLLQKSRSTEAHMQASMIFTSNDVIVNIGVIAAGVMVFLTGSPLPDLVIGMIIFGIVVRGAVRILKLSR